MPDINDSVVGALAVVAPELRNAENHILPLYAPTPETVIRAAGVSKPHSFFQRLPPTLLSSKMEPHANVLYGTSKPSPLPEAAYQPGVHKQPAGATIVGAAFLDIDAARSIAVPVVVYLVKDEKDANSEASLVAHIFDAPMALLEQQLYSERVDGPTQLEDDWMGKKLATKLDQLRVATGALARRHGLATMPGCLISGDYHLLRNGPIAMLGLRAPKHDAERETLCELVAAIKAAWTSTVLLSADEKLGGERFPAPAKLVAVFDRACVPHASPPATVDAAVEAVARRPVCLDVAVCMLVHDLKDAREEAVHVLKQKAVVDYESAARKRELAEASEMARGANASSDASQFSLRCVTKNLTGSCLMRRVAAYSPGEHELHKLAISIFNSADAALAVRDLKAWKEGESNGRNTLFAIGSRVAPPNALLIIELDSYRNLVLSATLISSAFHHERIGADECARLLTFRKVTPICCATGTDRSDKSGFILLESADARDKCCVTEEVRHTYAPAPPRPTPPAATAADVAQLRHDLTAKIESLCETVGSFKKQTAVAAPGPSRGPSREPPQPSQPPQQAQKVQKPLVAVQLERSLVQFERMLKKQKVGAPR